MIFTHKDVFLPRQTEKALKFCFEYEGGFLSRQTFSFEYIWKLVFFLVKYVKCSKIDF